jgi:hypothetical protein
VLSVLLASVVVATAAQPVDTAVDLRRGDRVAIGDVTGSLSITAWDRDVLEVTGDLDEASVSIARSGSEVRLTGGRRRRGRAADLRVRVPAWVALEIGSRSLDVSIRGVDGAIRVGNVRGDVRIEDADGDLDVRSISGEITITDARGSVRASSQADDVTLTRVSGAVEAHSGDGDIRLEDMRSRTVRAEAQDGDVDFDGVIAPDGEYGFFLHDGDATITVPASTGAHVNVSTFDGEFESDFTVKADRFTSGREFDFALGDGGAHIQIEVFDGDIHLRRRR